jgi:predicted ATPase
MRRHCEPQEVCGTPFYMSPEQAAGQSATAASDSYAVGVMLYEALTNAYQTTLCERPCVVSVQGPSGIGKTALVDAFIDGIRENRTAMILRARCYEREQVPFKAIDPVVDALTRFVRTLPVPLTAATLPRDLSALARLFPAVGRLDIIPDVPIKLELDPLEFWKRAFLALHEWICRIRDRQPVVIVIDDFQWACAEHRCSSRTLPCPTPRSNPSHPLSS